MTPQDKQPGKCCDKCFEDTYALTGYGPEVCKNPDCPCHQHPGLEEVLKNIEESLHRIIISPGYETAWFNKERTNLINGDRISGFLGEIKSIISHVYSLAYKNGREEVIKIAEGMFDGYKKFKFDGRPKSGLKKFAYQHALSDLISTLKSND